MKDGVGDDDACGLARVEARLSVLIWMMGANIAMTMAVMLLVFH